VKIQLFPPYISNHSVQLTEPPHFSKGNMKYSVSNVFALRSDWIFSGLSSIPVSQHCQNL